MIACNATTESLTLTLGGANAHNYTATYETLAPGAKVGEGVMKSKSGAPATTAAATIMPAPTTGGINVLRTLFVRNTTAVTTTVTLKKVISGDATYVLTGDISLASGESFAYDSTGKITMYTITGIVRTS